MKKLNNCPAVVAQFANASVSFFLKYLQASLGDSGKRFVLFLQIETNNTLLMFRSQGVDIRNNHSQKDQIHDPLLKVRILEVVYKSQNFRSHLASTTLKNEIGIKYLFLKTVLPKIDVDDNSNFKVVDVKGRCKFFVDAS